VAIASWEGRVVVRVPPVVYAVGDVAHSVLQDRAHPPVVQPEDSAWGEGIELQQNLLLAVTDKS